MSEEIVKYNTKQQRSLTVMSAGEIVRRLEIVRDVVDNVMVEGHHYGPPYKSSKKKVLLKPGAEVLQSAFQLDIQYQISKDKDGDHREYEVMAQAIHYLSGMVVGHGLGLCSTKEKKYRYRYSQPKCPDCGEETIMESKFGNGGYYCNKKAGGCGHKFEKNDQRITEQPTGKVENEDVAETYNTVLKIAKKRAQIDCILGVTAASDMFTQDLDDNPDYQNYTRKQEPSPQQTNNHQNQPKDNRPTNSDLDKLKKSIINIAYKLEDDGKRRQSIDAIGKMTNEKQLRAFGNRIKYVVNITEKVRDMVDKGVFDLDAQDLYMEELAKCNSIQCYKDLKIQIKDHIDEAGKNNSDTTTEHPTPKRRTVKQNTQKTATDDAVQVTQQHGTEVDMGDFNEYAKNEELPFK